MEGSRTAPGPRTATDGHRPLPGALTREATLVEHLPAGRVRCLACAHRCLIPPGRRGVCLVRFNRDGRLLAPWGYVAGLAADPVEKKPFFHLLPGATALTFGMLGCNFHCPYCQNWLTSQASRDAAAGAAAVPVSPEGVVARALRCGAGVVASSYNEPFITAEWAIEIFRQARAAGLRTAVVSNGYGTPEALQALRPWCDAVKIDLKAPDEARYRRLGGRLAPVLETIRSAHALGFWVEVVTLVVPGFNDAPEDLDTLASFLASVSPDIPWHLTAFHPDYRMLESPPTSPDALLRAAGQARRAGLRFVYVGNVAPAQAGPYEATACPGCARPVVERRGFAVTASRLRPGGRCAGCGTPLPGIWD